MTDAMVLNVSPVLVHLGWTEDIRQCPECGYWFDPSARRVGGSPKKYCSPECKYHAQLRRGLKIKEN